MEIKSKTFVKLNVEYRWGEYNGDYPLYVEVEITDKIKDLIKRTEEYFNIIGDNHNMEVRCEFDYYKSNDFNGESSLKVGYACLCLGRYGKAYVYAQSKYDSSINFETETFVLSEVTTKFNLDKSEL